MMPQLPPVLILAGGRGTRLGQLTDDLPKALVPVAGRPFLEHPLALLRDSGAVRIVIAVGYRGDLIERTIGNGERFGLEIDYAHDGPTLLGTAGAIRRALPLLGERFLVLYGDTYLRVDFGRFATAHRKQGLRGSMSVLRNRGDLSPSNAVVQGGIVTAYDKRTPPVRAEWIDYGLLAFEASVFEGVGPDDLSDVTSELATQRQLAAFEVSDRFYEIGTPEALAETEQFLRAS
jgi:N-acetyl-alpha-D-muramate 1-phosphate uridylyltransferase